MKKHTNFLFVPEARADKLTADIRADPDRKELYPCRSRRKSSKS